jgi:2-polyprenyl-3-methyl-5-hydroxy-6-metoxy-1,4-benzoquinol methylase
MTHYLSEKNNQTQCCVCGEALFKNPLLEYNNMPASAQGFLTLEMVPSDSVQDLLINQCSSCGLVQLNNAPVDYYREVIRAAAFSKEMREFRLAQLKDWVIRFQLNQQKVLEIGCGKGEYLSLLKAAGANAFGVEYAAQAISHCQTEGLQVFQGYLGDHQLKSMPNDFKGFMCLNFMEHWPNPNATLNELKTHLSDGAVGLIEVPNFDMIIEKGLFSEFISDHLLYFTQDTLRYTLQKNGFEVLECKSVWQDYILSVVVRKREPTNLTYFEQFHRDISNSLNTFISAFETGKVAIWGAGHQSLAVISLANLADKISYVIDSATFKQNKYTPASHLLIVAPSHLKKEPVDAVIIMAASYSDEVARTIRHEYSREIKVMILRDNGLEEVD